MPRLSKDIEEAKKQLAYYFQELSYGVANTKIQFRDKDELINFSMLDIITATFHNLDVGSMERFIDNLDSISVGIRQFYLENSNGRKEEMDSKGD